MSHVLTDEQLAKYLETMKTATDALHVAIKQRAEAEQKLLEMARIIDQSTQDLKLLVAFIISKGLEPPQIQSQFIN